MKRIMSIVLVLSLVLLFPLDIFAESETNAGEENTVESAEEKVYCDATIEDDFEEGRTILPLCTITVPRSPTRAPYTCSSPTEQPLAVGLKRGFPVPLSPL